MSIAFAYFKHLELLISIIIPVTLLQIVYTCMTATAPKIVSEYDQEIPQSQTADSPVALQGRAAQPSRDTRKTNLAKQSTLSSPSR